MVNDPIGDMIAQIKNASLAGNKRLKIPYSGMKERLAEILKNEGYIESVEKQGENPKYFLQINLKYQNKTSVITDIKRKSKPGLRVYVGKDKIPNVIGGMGTAILSTPKGIMTGKQARRSNLGGELLCIIW